MRALVLRIVLIFICLLTIQEPRLLAASQAIADGDSAYRDAKFAQSIADYQAALQAQPSDEQLLWRLINSYVAAKRPEIAMIYARRLSDVAGWSPTLYRQMGDLLETTGDFPQAIPYWQAALSGTRNDIPVLRKLTDVAIDWRDWDAGLKWLNQEIALDPNDDQSLYQRGLLVLPNDIQQGLNDLSAAAADPQYRSVATSLASLKGQTSAQPVALALLNLELWPYAEHALITALVQNPDDITAIAFLGLTEDHLGRDGSLLVNRAVEAAPANPVVSFAAAMHWRLRGDMDQALASLTQATALDPANPALAAEVGMIYRTEGKISDAAYWFNIAVALAGDKPGNADFKVLLATFYADENYDLTGQGLTTIQKMADQLPDNADVRASLGRALYTAGQADAARVAFDKALLLDPTNIRAHYFLATFLEARGDQPGAEDAYLYVYRNAFDSLDANGFKSLAARALKRLGYPLGGA